MTSVARVQERYLPLVAKENIAVPAVWLLFVRGSDFGSTGALSSTQPVSFW